MTENVKVKCKKCGHELPPGSSFCDKCGAPVSSNKKAAVNAAEREKRRSSVGKIICVIGIIIAVAAVFAVKSAARRSAETPDDIPSTEEQFESMNSRITPEQYEQLEFGMTYDEVAALFGEEGTPEYSDRVYLWPGEYADADEDAYYYSKPSVKLEFSDSRKLIDISERNVIDGKEIYEAKAEKKKSSIVANEEMFSSMKNRMSYREIADILGAEGVLTRSESDRSGYQMKMYEWRYVMEGEENPYENSLEITFYNDKARRDSWSVWGG